MGASFSGCNDLFVNGCPNPVPGVKWMTVAGSLVQAYCYFDPPTASTRNGWAVVAKIGGADRPYCGCNDHTGNCGWSPTVGTTGLSTQWGWGSSVYMASSPAFGNATAPPHLERTDAKSSLYGTLPAAKMRLATLVDEELSGPTWAYTGGRRGAFTPTPQFLISEPPT